VVGVCTEGELIFEPRFSARKRAASNFVESPSRAGEILAKLRLRYLQISAAQAFLNAPLIFFSNFLLELAYDARSNQRTKEIGKIIMFNKLESIG
jgi:hypothetical protein